VLVKPFSRLDDDNAAPAAVVVVPDEVSKGEGVNVAPTLPPVTNNVAAPSPDTPKPAPTVPDETAANNDGGNGKATGPIPQQITPPQPVKPDTPTPNAGANTGPPKPYPVLNPDFQVNVMLNVDAPGRVIPQNFMGFSHEWTHVEELYDIPQYPNILRLLASWGSGPIVLRVGGGSTDKLVTVPDAHVWESLRNLNLATGIKFILGVNFYNQDVNLSRNQMNAARAVLPGDSIINFELGNEVSA
jgi:hypothetical protein